jgi:hypothetical protein
MDGQRRTVATPMLERPRRAMCSGDRLVAVRSIRYRVVHPEIHEVPVHDLITPPVSFASLLSTARSARLRSQPAG